MRSLVKLVSISPDAEKTIVYCARVSSSDQDNPNIAKLLKYCIKHGHWSVFETAHVTIEVSTSRAISAQILRHRSLTFQEFSQRYQSVDNSGVVIYAARRQDSKDRQGSIDDLPEATKDEWELRQLENWKTSFEHYKWALDNGVAKECARFVLPLATSTRMYLSGNIRSFIHYIQSRDFGTGTQVEHSEIAAQIKQILIPHFPNTSEALEWTIQK